MRLELIVLWSRSGLIGGRAVDNHKYLALEEDMRLAVDRMINRIVRSYAILPAGWTRHPEPTRGASDPREGEQKQFRRSSIDYYDAHGKRSKIALGSDSERSDSTAGTLTDESESEGAHELLWCPITRDYFSGSVMKAAHIVPFAVGEFNRDYLFGRNEVGSDHLFCCTNGLLINAALEQAMDQAQTAIVPADHGNLEVIVLDRSILRRPAAESTVPWPSLEGRVLEFRNDNRPRLRYLYFTFLMRLFRRRRYECTGWKNDLFQYAKGGMWGSPGKWLRASTLKSLARRVGHEPDLESFLDTADLPLEAGQDDSDDNGLVADEIYDAYEYMARGSPARRARTIAIKNQARSGSSDDEEDD